MKTSASSVESVRSVDQLVKLISTGAPADFVFFWGHTAKDGAITQACLSQWWQSSFTVDGIMYPTAEHYMMAAKARLFGDSAALARILSCEHPKQAKEHGRSVTGFDERTWVEERFGIAVMGNHGKFSQNSSLQHFLLGTGNKVLVEASPVDPIWGIGLASDDKRARQPSQWRGLNLLGFALMEVRDRLRVTR